VSSGKIFVSGKQKRTIFEFFIPIVPFWKIATIRERRAPAFSDVFWIAAGS
jgi:hypothetical protein